MIRAKHQYRVTRISQYLALASLLAGEGHEEERMTFEAGEEEEDGQKYLMTTLMIFYYFIKF